jgi:hypothetical protein
MGGSADIRYNGTWIVQRSVEMDQPIVRALLVPVELLVLIFAS